MAEKRFEKIYEQGAINGVNIWLDRVTGVQYLYFWGASGAGATPLLDRDGKPVISPPAED